MAKSELLKRSSITDWLLTVFTLALIWVGFYQFRIMDGQLAVMRIDQRAWVSVVTPRVFPLDGTTIPAKIQIINTGKTFAKNVAADFIATVLNAGEEPAFDEFGEGHPHNRLYAGAIYPNAPEDVTVTVVKYGAKTAESIVPTLGDLPKRLKDGTSFIILYGKLTYCDAFGVKHWTKFCQGSGDALGSEGIKKCIAYNDADSNDTSTGCK